MAVTEHQGATPQAVAAHIAGLLNEAIAARGRASLAVSGGKSPVALFEALRTQVLDWTRVHIVLLDERVVPHDHADSNTALVKRHLLQGPAAAAHWTPFFETPPPTLCSVAALDALVNQACARLAALPWPLDVAVLGMGEDAHTASLFPGAAGYQHAITTLERLAWVMPAAAPHARISFTLQALLDARERVLPLCGTAKLAVYRRAVQHANPALPISLVLTPTQTHTSVWIG